MPIPRIVEVSSPSPFERGVQYGSATTDLVAQSITYYREAFAHQAGLDWDQALEHAQQWQGLVQEQFPDLYDEMRGIAQGAGVELAEIVALNCRGEIIYDNWFAARNAGAPTRDEADGCTSFSLTGTGAGDGHVYAGQNWDWRHGVRGTVVVLRVIQPPKPTLIMQVEAGQVGRHGASSAGIALNANGLGGRFEDKIGIPQTVIRRAVLDSENISDALKVLVRARAHIASNALLTDRSGFSIDLETTPGAHGWEYPVDGALVHGNHYQAFVPPQLADDHRPMSPDSLLRVPRAREGLLRAAVPDATADVRSAIHTAMSDHLGHPDSLCAHPDPRLLDVEQWSTTISSCVDLTTGDYFIAGGPPCENPFELVPFNLYS
jgi:isopenicillin-N N-acyltransferase-like protein